MGRKTKYEKGISIELRDKVLTELVLQHRENIKKDRNRKLVGLFSIYASMDITYDEFIDIILSLESQEYLRYIPSDKSKKRILIRGEKVPQEFVELTTPKGTSYLETKLDKSNEDVNINLKRPLQVQVLTTLATLLLSTAPLNLLWRLIKRFLSLFHF